METREHVLLTTDDTYRCETTAPLEDAWHKKTAQYKRLECRANEMND